MNKILIKSFFIIVLISTVLISCKTDNRTPTIEKDAIAETLKFIDVNERIANLDHKIKIVIVEWDWGRTSHNCHGFGVCKVIWFPKKKNNNSSHLEMASFIEYNENTNFYYVDALLSEPLPSNIDPDDLTGTIDFDIPIQNENGENVISEGLNFKQGVFEFDTSLGDFGGYRFILE